MLSLTLSLLPLGINSTELYTQSRSAVCYFACCVLRGELHELTGKSTI